MARNPGKLGITFGCKPYAFRGFQNGVELLHRRIAGIGDGGERNYLGRIATRKIPGDGELAMPGVQGAPDGVGEETFRKDGHPG